MLRMISNLSPESRLSLVQNSPQACEYIDRMYWLSKCEREPSIEYCETLRAYNEL